MYTSLQVNFVVQKISWRWAAHDRYGILIALHKKKHPCHSDRWDSRKWFLHVFIGKITLGHVEHHGTTCNFTSAHLISSKIPDLQQDTIRNTSQVVYNIYNLKIDIKRLVNTPWSATFTHVEFMSDWIWTIIRSRFFFNSITSRVQRNMLTRSQFHTRRYDQHHDHHPHQYHCAQESTETPRHFMRNVHRTRRFVTSVNVLMIRTCYSDRIVESLVHYEMHWKNWEDEHHTTLLP